MTGIGIYGFVVEYFKDILYILGAILSLFVGRKLEKLRAQKEEVNIQAGELENVEKALKIYRTMLNDMQEKLKEAEDAYEYLEGKFTKALERNKALEAENATLKQKLDETPGNSK